MANVDDVATEPIPKKGSTAPKRNVKKDPINPVEQVNIVNFGKLQDLSEKIPLIEATEQTLTKPFIAVIGCGKLEIASNLVAQAQAYASTLRTKDVALSVIVFEDISEYETSVTATVKHHEVAFISKDRTVIHTTSLQRHGIPSILIQSALSKPFNASIAKSGKNRNGKRKLEQKTKGRVKNKKLNGAW